MQKTPHDEVFFVIVVFLHSVDSFYQGDLSWECFEVTTIKHNRHSEFISESYTELNP